ncbi:MAG: hypothetical protein AAFX78_09975 [Cyanobacteria bacterium J06638_20]
MVNRWLLAVSLGFLSILAGTVSPSTVSAQTRTFARCETERTTVRIYDEGDGLMMRAYDRLNNIEWLDVPARSNPNREGTDYFNIRGEVAVRVYAPDDADQPCFVVLGSNPPQSGRLIGDDPIAGIPDGNPGNPTAICQGRRNRVRIFTFRDSQMMRAESLRTGAIWLDTAARSTPLAAGTEYVNNQGEQTVRLFVPTDISTPCTITIGNESPEEGTLLREPTPLR